MKYIISEEDIKLIQVQGWNFRRLVKSKTPIEVIAEGEIRHRVNQTGEDSFELEGIEIVDKNGKEVYVADLIPYDYAIKNEGKKGKLIWVEEIE